MRRLSSALLLVLAGGLVAGEPAASQTSIGSPTSSEAPIAAKTTAAAKRAAAKTAAKPKSHKPDPYQSPLATIMQSHLRADVPEAQDFVRESRPAAKDLKYTPLQSQMGADPVRPKPRDPANVMALQAELEASLSRNEARGGLGKSKARRAKANAAAD